MKVLLLNGSPHAKGCTYTALAEAAGALEAAGVETEFVHIGTKAIRGCIGCGKCQKVCAFGAITIENNLAYIDPQKCKLCRKCVNECPTGAIVLAGMDPLPKVPKAPAAPKASPAAKEASAGVPTAPDAGATPAVSAAETPKAE